MGERLGISAEELLPTTYYRMNVDAVMERCGAGGCARIVDGAIQIFDSAVLEKHELVHAVHLSAWPRRRPLLTEGLAVVLDDTNHAVFDSYSLYADREEFDLDTLLEIEHPDIPTYIAGSWIVFWILERHGADAFREFWLADSKDSSAEDFRALFEAHFGESLDAMLADVAGQQACPLVTCVEDVVEWQGDVWSTESPSNCGDGLTVGTEAELVRAVLIEVPTTGSYTVSVSESELGNRQAVNIHPCGGPCEQTADHPALFLSGDDVEVVWDAGLYRVTTGKVELDDPGVRVEIKPL